MEPETPNSENAVRLNLSSSEALVLFEFLSRFNEKKSLEIADQSEERVLWDILSTLESVLAEPLSKDYEVHLRKAREEVRDAP